MRKQQWPSTVKVCWYQSVLGLSGNGVLERLPLEIGQKQVAVLLALQIELARTVGLSSNISFWLYRKTEGTAKEYPWRQPAGEWQKDTNVIDVTYGYVAGESMASAYKVYPYPIVLIRPPSLIYHTSVEAGSVMTLGLWYVLQDVTDKEMSELLMKDHA